MQKMLSMLRRGVVLALSCFDFAIAIVTSLTDSSLTSLRCNGQEERFRGGGLASRLRHGGILSSQGNDRF